jgi:hypothetical protein
VLEHKKVYNAFLLSELPPILQNLLAQCGLSHESVQKVRFGGIVGKIALVSMLGFIAAIGVAKYTAGTGPVQFVGIGGVLVTTLLINYMIIRYAERHPASAAMDGAEMILWQQQIITLAAKGLTLPQESALIPNPEGKPPQSNPPQGKDQ